MIVICLLSFGKERTEESVCDVVLWSNYVIHPKIPQNTTTTIAAVANNYDNY